MGFLTNYQITLEGFDNEADDKIKANALNSLLRRVTLISGYDFHIDDNAICINDSSKWYEHPEHLIQISSEQQFSNLLITADCFCSEVGEGWKFYAKNGKGYKAVSIELIPGFDESKLQSEECEDEEEGGLPYTPESLIVVAEQIARLIKSSKFDEAIDVVKIVGSYAAIFLIHFLQGTYITDIPMISKEEMNLFLDNLRRRL